MCISKLQSVKFSCKSQMAVQKAHDDLRWNDTRRLSEQTKENLETAFWPFEAEFCEKWIPWTNALKNVSVVPFFYFAYLNWHCFYMNFYGNLAIDKYWKVFNIDPEERLCLLLCQFEPLDKTIKGAPLIHLGWCFTLDLLFQKVQVSMC